MFLMFFREKHYCLINFYFEIIGMPFSYAGSDKSILITSSRNAVFRQNFTFDQRQYESFECGIEDLKQHKILIGGSGRLGNWRRISYRKFFFEKKSVLGRRHQANQIGRS